MILCAGKGGRLGADMPKCLLRVGGSTLLQRQLQALADCGIDKVWAVTGFQERRIRRACPGLRCVRNPEYARSNTARSLAIALRALPAGDVLWLNGDVLVETGVLRRLLRCRRSAMAVDRKACGSEEMKYLRTRSGLIATISKALRTAHGEALGVNIVRERDRIDLLRHLEGCDASDYFEEGIRRAIRAGGTFRAVDVSGRICIDIDFKKDLYDARRRSVG